MIARSVWLVGLSGGGKSTVGLLLAKRLGYQFFDLDSAIQELANDTIPSLFHAGGESHFRELEASESGVLQRKHEVVVATGGGWMARNDIPKIWEGCIRVWLRVSPEVALHRLGENAETLRPMLVGPERLSALKGMLLLREGAYAEAEIEVDTVARRPEEVAEAIHHRLLGDDT
jgi:shikimate kinase